jgi:hypothetical protein
LIPHSEWEETQAAAHAKSEFDVDGWRIGDEVTGSGSAVVDTRIGGRLGRRRKVRYAEEDLFEDDDFDEFDQGRGKTTRSHGSGALFDDGKSIGSGMYDEARLRGDRSQGSGGIRDGSRERERDRRSEKPHRGAKMDAYDEDGVGGQVPQPRSTTTAQDHGIVHSRYTRTSTDEFHRGPTRVMSTNPGSASSATQQPLPARKLFDPHIHDPVKFAQAPSQSTGGSTSRTGGSSALLGHSSYPGAINARKGSSLATSVSLEPPSVREREKDEHRHRSGVSGNATGGGGPGRRYPINEDEEGDRERERRRRKDGSERGSQNQGRNKRDDDGKSRGSRSSEGSESLKDRERGRGNRLVGGFPSASLKGRNYQLTDGAIHLPSSDTGIMFRLREAYKVIQALEHKLTDMHRMMSVDPSAGVRVLINAGLLGQGLTTAPSANIAGTGGSGQSFNPIQGNGAVAVIRQAMDDEEDEYSRRPIVPRQSRPLPAEVMEDEAWVELVALHKQ